MNSNYNSKAFKYQFSFVIFSNTLLKATVCFLRCTWYFVSGTSGKESTCNAGDMGSIPGLGRSPGGGKGYPLQYSGLDNSKDCIVHGVTKSQTRQRDFHLAETGLRWGFSHMLLPFIPLWPLPLPLVFVTGFYPDFPPTSPETLQEPQVFSHPGSSIVSDLGHFIWFKLMTPTSRHLSQVFLLSLSPACSINKPIWILHG